MKRLILIICLLLTLSMPVSAKVISEKVSESLGYKLTVIALDWMEHLRKTGVLKNTTGFHIYLISARGENNTGWYAVNRWTGDVWDINGNCKHLTNPRLRLEQKKIKKRFSDEELNEYEHLSRLEPYRMRDFGPCGSQK